MAHIICTCNFQVRKFTFDSFQRFGLSTLYKLTSLVAEAAEDLGLAYLSSPPPPSEGLLSAARAIFGEVLGLLLVEEGWDDIRGREAVLCVMVCTTGLRRGVTVVPDTKASKLNTKFKRHFSVSFIECILMLTECLVQSTYHITKKTPKQIHCFWIRNTNEWLHSMIITF